MIKYGTVDALHVEARYTIREGLLAEATALQLAPPVGPDAETGLRLDVSFSPDKKALLLRASAENDASLHAQLHEVGRWLDRLCRVADPAEVRFYGPVRDGLKAALAHLNPTFHPAAACP